MMGFWIVILGSMEAVSPAGTCQEKLVIQSFQNPSRNCICRLFAAQWQKGFDGQDIEGLIYVSLMPNCSVGKVTKSIRTSHSALLWAIKRSYS